MAAHHGRVQVRSTLLALADNPGCTPASLVGDEVFMDFNGWHLYLKDVKVAGSVSLAQSLAYQLGSGQTDLKDLLFRWTACCV